MRKKFAVAAMLLAVAVWFGCKSDDGPIRIADEPGAKPFLYPPFKENQVIVMYKEPPTPGRVTKIKEELAGSGIDTNNLVIRKCSDCAKDVELWEAVNIHSTVHTEGVSGGTGGRTKGVGEDSIAWYSLNFINPLPLDTPGNNNVSFATPGKTEPVSGVGKDTIVVAVLDTGIDTANWVHNANLWTNKREDPDSTDDDGNCRADDVNGWNFVNNSNNLQEDHRLLHGSLVSQYIINQFANSTKNFLQLMVLKTHDGNGNGDLFGSICAIHYAMNNGAHIINASWGFYYYYETPPPYLTDLITNKLAARGILFVAAAGNAMHDVDIQARDIYRERYGIDMPDEYLRDLYYHNFFPACYSTRDNNVLTVTTTDGNQVSKTQNWNSQYVDLGVLADYTAGGTMQFKVPFSGNSTGHVSGSSFAAAIASGKVGAIFKKEFYTAGINKSYLMPALINYGPGIVNVSSSMSNERRIREGRYIKP